MRGENSSASKSHPEQPKNVISCLILILKTRRLSFSTAGVFSRIRASLDLGASQVGAAIPILIMMGGRIKGWLQHTVTHARSLAGATISSAWNTLAAAAAAAAKTAAATTAAAATAAQIGSKPENI